MRIAILRHVGVRLGMLWLVVACAGGETRADTPASAQGGTPLSNWRADSSAIVATLASSRAGWNQADIDAHYAMYDDSVAFVFVPRGEDPPIRSLPNVRAMAGDLFKGKKLPPTTDEPILVRPIGADAALTVSRFTMRLPNGSENKGLTTLVWRRTPVGWRVIADHTS